MVSSYNVNGGGEARARPLLRRLHSDSFELFLGDAPGEEERRVLPAAKFASFPFSGRLTHGERKISRFLTESVVLSIGRCYVAF